MDFLIIKPVTSAAEVQAIQEAAKADPRGHYPVCPTHYALRGGEIVGSLSVCAMPVSGIWSHSEKMGARGTAELVNIARNLAHAVSGGKKVVTLCAESSPIFPHMEPLGFKKLGSTVLFIE